MVCFETHYFHCALVTHLNDSKRWQSKFRFPSTDAKSNRKATLKESVSFESVRLVSKRKRRRFVVLATPTSFICLSLSLQRWRGFYFHLTACWTKQKTQRIKTGMEKCADCSKRGKQTSCSFPLWRCVEPHDHLVDNNESCRGAEISERRNRNWERLRRPQHYTF